MLWEIINLSRKDLNRSHPSIFASASVSEWYPLLLSYRRFQNWHRLFLSKISPFFLPLGVFIWPISIYVLHICIYLFVSIIYLSVAIPHLTM